MLFNSYSFILLFLLPTLLLYYSIGYRYRLGFLIFASLVFYAQSGVEYLVILLGSIVVNYIFAYLISRNYHRKATLIVAISLDLTLLIHFKYSYFLHLSDTPMILPLAISFYTFQQIAFLVDIYREEVEMGSFGDYLFFVSFFPQLIAGPIVHYKQIVAQLKEGVTRRVEWIYIEKGIFLFCLGLFKKIVIADMLFPIANHAFGHIESLTTLQAWEGIVSYSLALYFDFSGYTDMALGLALLFGFLLPINFDSPYRAVDIIDFWRRWHITLSNFLRDYIYIPLGGNRVGEYRATSNLIITMTLGGIWHGAGWTFVLWGVLHGVWLALAHLVDHHFPRWSLPRPLAILVTFLLVSLLWVLFRADDPSSAWHYYERLFDFTSRWDTTQSHLYLLIAGIALVWFFPNSMTLSHYKSQERLTPRYALFAALLGTIALKMMAQAPAQSFVYFKF